VVIKKGAKVLGRGRSTTAGRFNVRTKKHKKGKLVVQVRSKTTSTSICRQTTKSVPGRN
jgi:hypothetical protein